MKLNYTRFATAAALSAFFFSASVGFSQNEKGFSLLNQAEQTTSIAFENPAFTQSSIDVDGTVMTKIMTAEGATNLEAGMPNVPHYSQSIVIPNEGNTTLEVTYSDYYDIPNVEIAPSKGNLYRNIYPADVPYEFGPAYNVDAFYPGH